jgi:hypothetical protein
MGGKDLQRATGEEVAWAMCNTQRGHRDMLTSSEIELLEVIEQGLKTLASTLLMRV